jgi:hypothetical protein
MNFFLIPMLAMVLMAARGGIEAFARFSEIVFLVFAVTLALLFMLFLPNVRIWNLLPVTPGDAAPAMLSALPVVSIWGHVTLFFFLGERVSNLRELRAHTRKPMVYLIVMTTLIMIMVVGSLGPSTVTRMPAPFFSAAKLISVLRSFERMETVLLALWIVSDFVTILAFAVISMNIAKKLFGASRARLFASPTVLLGYAGGLCVASNGLELEKFSSSPALLTTAIIMGAAMPLLTLTAGKIRRKL